MKADSEQLSVRLLTNMDHILKVNQGQLLAFMTLTVIIALFVYGGSLRYFFWQDDFNLLYLAKNGSIVDYTELSFTKPKEIQPVNFGVVFRPVPHYFYFDVINAVFGLNPLPYRVVNFVVVIFSALLVYYCASIFSGKNFVGYAAAVLFVINRVLFSPMYWISVNNETFLTLFALIGLASYVRAIDQKANRRVLVFVSHTSMTLALLTKETAVAIPVLIVIFILLRVGSQTFRSRLGSCVGLWPQFVLIALFIAIRAPFIFYALEGGGGSYYTTSKYARLPIHYLWGVWWNLETFVEPWRTILNGITRTYSLFQPVYLALITIVAAGVIAAWSMKRETDRVTGRAVLAGIVWFIVAALPPLLTGILVDYLFVLPSVGFVMAVAAVLDLLRSVIGRWSNAIANIGVVGILTLSVISSAFLVRVLEQTTWPASDMTLTVRTLESLREHRAYWSSTEEVCITGIPNDNWWSGRLEPAARLFVDEHVRILEATDSEGTPARCPVGVPAMTYIEGRVVPVPATHNTAVTVGE